MPVNFSASPITAEVAVNQLPIPTVATELKEIGGKQGVFVSIFFPLPEDDQVEKRERFGKKTVDKVTKEVTDNSGTLTSKLSIYGRAADVPLTFEQNGETVVLKDADGTPIMVRATMQARLKLVEEADDSNDPDSAEV